MLFVGRFENDDSSAELLEQFRAPEAISVKSSTERHGTERIEAVIQATSKQDAYERYRTHHGQRLAIYSPRMTRPISGNITSLQLLAGNRVLYVAKGAHNRMIDIPDTTVYDSTDTVSDAIENILDVAIIIDDGNTDNIEANATTLNGWQPNRPEGGYALDEIDELVAKSDSSNSVYDFVLIDQPMKATALQKFTAYYTKRQDSASPDWVVSLSDLRGTPNLTRSIDGFATTSQVWYGLVRSTATSGSDTTMGDTTRNFLVAGVIPGDRIDNLSNGGYAKITDVAANSIEITGTAFHRGTCTGGSTSTLINTETNFVTEGVVAGDAVYNDLDDSRGVVTSITTTTNTNDTLNISGNMSSGKQNDAGERYRVVHSFSSGDDYSIRTDAQTKNSTSSTDTTPYWERVNSVFESSMDGEQATDYAEVLADTDPVQSQSIIVGSKYIRDNNGALWPLVEVAARCGGYIQIDDLYPASALATTSRDRLTTFKITSINYNHQDNTLTLSLDTPDTGLDARLRRANIIDSELAG